MTRPEMPRRFFLVSGTAMLALAACGPAKGEQDIVEEDTTARFADSKWRELTEAEWRERLSPDAFRVMRKEGTERRFTSPLNAESRKGTYACKGCGLALFSSDAKFDSGTGWPSFYDHIPGALATKPDRKLLVVRTEYHCARCLSHQGHVFEDGPPPTGLRYCNNGVALDFVPA